MTSNTEPPAEDTSSQSGEELPATAGEDIELITDGEGLVVIGDRQPSRNSHCRRVCPRSPWTSTGWQRAREAHCRSRPESPRMRGRWMKLTEESARAAHGATFVQRSGGAFIQANPRRERTFHEESAVRRPSPARCSPTQLCSPASADSWRNTRCRSRWRRSPTTWRRSTQRSTNYLRSQKDAVLADMIGVEMMLDEAMVVRAEVGRVSEVTWSKIQGSAATVARTQAYALRQLQSLADKLEREAKIGELAISPRRRRPRSANGSPSSRVFPASGGDERPGARQGFGLVCGGARSSPDCTPDSASAQTRPHRIDDRSSRRRWMRPRSEPMRRCCSTRSRPRSSSAHATPSPPT